MIDLNGVEKGCGWYFAPGVNYNVGPTDAAGQNFTGSWDSLIRECIQNSLDAVNDRTKPVKVKLEFRSMPMKSYKNFFKLKDHIECCLKTFPDTARDKYLPILQLFDGIMSEFNAKMPYLQISDYNTNGMSYDEGNDSCNFSAFVRGLGVHGGDQSASGRGGSFGLGKSTIFTMSPLRTMMVATYTSEGKHVFEGVASLTTHKMGGDKLSHIGYYDNRQGLPITDADQIPPRFIRKAGDDGTTPSGTDIYIMGRGEDDGDIDDIKKQVLAHYWLSILKCKLEVEIVNTSKSSFTISKDNLSELMESTFTSLVDNARKSINPRPYYDAVIGVDSPKDKHTQKRLPLLGDVELYLMKNKDAKNDRLTFFRLPCMMVMRKSTSQLMLRINNYGVYGAFVCVDSNGDRLLKRLENAAHDEWSETNWKNASNTRADAKAIKIMDELRNFLAEEIESFCKTAGQTSLKMIGAGKYLYTVQDVVDMENDEIRSPENGYISTNIVTPKETGAKQAEYADDYKSSEVIVPVGMRHGNVTNIMGGATADMPDDKPGKLEIKVQMPTKKKNKTQVKNIGGNMIKSASPSDKPAALIVPIDFKVYANEENGHIIHNVCIICDQDVESALIQFAAKRDDGKIDNELEIIDSFGVGAFHGMDLRDVKLRQGDNMLKVRFSDDTKHSLNINVKS